MGNGRALKFAELKIRRISRAISKAWDNSNIPKKTIEKYENILQEWKKVTTRLRQN
jgi:hypothetical protein